MKKIINYEKDIEFNTKIGEITSISLEDFFDIEENKLEGHFLINGEYKTNELSINKESFEYKLPLEYELDDDVDLETIKKEIDNFEYKVNDNILNIIIDYSLAYEVKPIIPSEEELNRPIEPALEEKKIESVKEEVKESDEEEETALYHIHMFKESETIESIAALYKTDASLIKEYNDTTNISDKDKIIVPLCDE